MTGEERFVVRPLVRWFRRQRAGWQVRTPRYATSATGWDLIARRKHVTLLIEAKYAKRRGWQAMFTGLVTAPLANRRIPVRTQQRVCWAIGGHVRRQLLLDYVARHLVFWRHYAKDLRLQYVFFVNREQVARVRFETILTLAAAYRTQAHGRSLAVRRTVAERLLGRVVTFG